MIDMFIQQNLDLYYYDPLTGAQKKGNRVRTGSALFPPDALYLR